MLAPGSLEAALAVSRGGNSRGSSGGIEKPPASSMLQAMAHNVQQEWSVSRQIFIRTEISCAAAIAYAKPYAQFFSKFNVARLPPLVVLLLLLVLVLVQELVQVLLLLLLLHAGLSSL